MGQAVHLRNEEQSETTAPAPTESSQARRRKRYLADRLARFVVNSGGFLVILSISAIFVVIFLEAAPLFRKADFSLTAVAAKAQSRALVVGSDEYREIGYVLDSAGSINFFSLNNGKPIEKINVTADGVSLTSIAKAGDGRYLAAASDNQLIPITISFRAQFDDEVRTIIPSANVGEPVLLAGTEGAPAQILGYFESKKRFATILRGSGSELDVVIIQRKRALGGDVTSKRSDYKLSLPDSEAATTAVFDEYGRTIFLGTDAGSVVAYELKSLAEGSSLFREAVSSNATAITALDFILGKQALVVGDASGGIASWLLLRDQQTNQFRIDKRHQFDSLAQPISLFAHSPRNRTFAAVGNEGKVSFHYSTSKATYQTIQPSTGPGIFAMGFAPKGDGLIAAADDGNVYQWTIDNPHPEATWGTLFGKVWYEGYADPAFVWQSTGGTDEFESKLSLVPLIFGTLKGTFYALLFAIPIAVLSALYTSEFMRPRLKAVVKPLVELMAAIPTVVIGFIAGLWLAPALVSVVPGVFLFPIITCFVAVAAAVLWSVLPDRIRLRIPRGVEPILLLPVVALSLWASFQLGYLVEQAYLGGDYQRWLRETWQITYDQRNSLIVGIAMGFAVIPIIYTLSEDTLNSVPKHLRAGSLALGASKWQTALLIVLPAASPGIFSAIMIGLGRAVGETMIVLMATGNTPLMDLSMFNGFRAMSANIAVELPEAPHGGTLYRILFLSALLLFIMTFVVNTITELVRIRLRRKYKQL